MLHLTSMPCGISRQCYTSKQCLFNFNGYCIRSLGTGITQCKHGRAPKENRTSNQQCVDFRTVIPEGNCPVGHLSILYLKGFRSTFGPRPRTLLSKRKEPQDFQCSEEAQERTHETDIRYYGLSRPLEIATQTQENSLPDWPSEARTTGVGANIFIFCSYLCSLYVCSFVCRDYHTLQTIGLNVKLH